MVNLPEPGRVDGRSLRYRHRRPELLDTVTAYVLEHGVGGLSMRPLAAAIGVSHGTLLHHFGSKEGLVTEVIAALLRRLSEDAGADTDDGTGPLDRWWRASTTDERMDVYRVLFEVYTHAAREPERYEAFLDQIVHGALRLAEALVRADGCPAADAPAVATMIVAQARGAQLDLLATGDRERVDLAFGVFAGLVAGLRREWER